MKSFLAIALLACCAFSTTPAWVSVEMSKPNSVACTNCGVLSLNLTACGATWKDVNIGAASIFYRCPNCAAFIRLVRFQPEKSPLPTTTANPKTISGPRIKP